MPNSGRSDEESRRTNTVVLSADRLRSHTTRLNLRRNPVPL